MDDLYTARAAIRQPAPAGCGGVAHRRPTLHGPPSGSRRRSAAGWWRTGSLLAWTTSTLHWPPSGSRLRPAAACWFTILSQPAADLLLAVRLELVRHLPLRKLYCILATAWQPALAGCWRLRLPSCDAPGYPPGCPPSQPYSPLGSPSPALLGPLTHICGLDKTPPPEGRGGAGDFMAWATVGLPAGGVAK